MCSVLQYSSIIVVVLSIILIIGRRRCYVPYLFFSVVVPASSCSRQPVFGYPGQPRKACAAHKAADMEGKTVVSHVVIPKGCIRGGGGGGSLVQILACLGVRGKEMEGCCYCMYCREAMLACLARGVPT